MHPAVKQALGRIAGSQEDTAAAHRNAAPSVEDGSEARTVEQWALRYLRSISLSEKCQPPPAPAIWEDANPRAEGTEEALGWQHLLRPGRPPELRVTLERPRSVKLGALVRPEARARLVHKFWHHELQAAELMCWALLRFVEAPRDFKEGLLRIFRDEVRHMGLYADHLGRLGYAIGDFPVRDWFWERVPTCETPLQFVALLGMGLEGANLEHTERFAQWFRSVGDLEGAEIQDQVGREEVAHVRFATRWFRSWTGDVDFEQWRRSLPPPLSPLLLRGKRLRRDLRKKAEMPDDFLDRLETWQPPG